VESAPAGLECALLGLLRGAPTHAYDLHQRLARAEALGLVWHLKQSHLYALLTRLEEAGFLTSTMESRGARPPRKMLSLTPSGRDAFARWVPAPVAHGRDFRLEFLAKLYFAAAEGPAAVAALVERQRTACLAWLADLRAEAARLGDAQPYARLVLGFRSSQIEAILAWLETCAATLEASS
jgi:DNA-binding PadR family transcriptional regulator